MLRVVKLAAVVLWIALCSLLAFFCIQFKKLSWRDRISCVCYRGLLRIVGLRLMVQGDVSAARPLLIVSNHVSYLDVVILGSVFPFRFTPKQEIAKWPAIGGICRLTGCVFVDRHVRGIQTSMQEVRAALQRGDVISLFPESTTGNGIEIGIFKPAFFHLADQPLGDAELTIQPAAISYTHVGGLPIDSCQWPMVAWYGDMVLVPHLWELLKLGRIRATLVFLPPASLHQYGDRKGLAAHCRNVISEAIQASRHLPSL